MLVGEHLMAQADIGAAVDTVIQTLQSGIPIARSEAALRLYEATKRVDHLTTARRLFEVRTATDVDVFSGMLPTLCNLVG